jgi:hypothetical protein
MTQAQNKKYQQKKADRRCGMPNVINQFDNHSNWFLLCKKAQKYPLMGARFFKNPDSILLPINSFTPVCYHFFVI